MYFYTVSLHNRTRGYRGSPLPSRRFATEGSTEANSPLLSLQIRKNTSKLGNFDECVPVATHLSKHIHRIRLMCPSCNTLVETHSSKYFFTIWRCGKVATPPNTKNNGKKGLVFFFDECVSTNVLQLVHIHQNFLVWRCFS